MDGDLIDHQHKCRFCLGKIKSARIAVQISTEIRKSFFTLTNSKLKTSSNYSLLICKTCLKDLESSVGFQQKILVNQQRLEKFEFEDSPEVPVKEEAFEAEELKTVEIKTECFEFETETVVVQTWQESPKKEDAEPEIKIDEVPVESPASADSDEDFIGDSIQEDSSENSDEMHVQEPSDKIMEKASKVPETSKLLICPYCAEEFSRNGIKSHIETHENKINNTPLKCEFCDYQCYNSNNLKAHCKSNHPEKVKPKKNHMAMLKELGLTALERRKLILKTVQENPSWNLSRVSKSLKVSIHTVRRVLKAHKTRNSLERRKGAGRKIRTQPTETEKRIAESFIKDPEMSCRKRGKLLGINKTAVHRFANKMGYKVEVDESLRIYQCKLCPRKYAHNTTLNAHIKEKHTKPE